MSDQTAGSLETPQDAGKGGPGEVVRWLLELKLADKQEKDWREQARKTIKAYRGSQGDEKTRQRRFNILWANTETLKPALYAQLPKPVCTRRFKDNDPVAREASEALERALSYSLDAYDFDQQMRLAIVDYVLPGRATVKVEYKPVFGKAGPEGQQVEVKQYESVECALVQWDSLRIGPAKVWDNVPWIAFEHKLTKDEWDEKFPGKEFKPDISPDIESRNKDEKAPLEAFKRVRVWEIWDKDKKRKVFIAASVKTGPLKIENDPLGLSGFYPIPRPLYSVESSDSLVPVDEYSLYKDQAEELDVITRRITKLTAALKFNGIYDSTIEEMSRLKEAEDGEFIPAQNASALLDRGGLEKSVLFIPIERLAQVLAQLYMQRDQCKQIIYEVTGLSDILRGVAEKGATATEQNIKAQYGGLRIQRRQREVQRFIRDVMRLKAEIISEKFSPETLQLMTGVQITDPIMQILRSDFMRGVRVDIETDSTVAANETEEKQAAVDLLAGLGQFIQMIGPAVQSGEISKEQAKALMMFALRRFKAGRDVEQIIESDSGAAAPPTPEQLQQAMQQAQGQLQGEAQKVQEQSQQVEQEAQRVREERMKLDYDKQVFEIAKSAGLTEISTKQQLAQEKFKSSAQSTLNKQQQRPAP